MLRRHDIPSEIKSLGTYLDLKVFSLVVDAAWKARSQSTMALTRPFLPQPHQVLNSSEDSYQH